MPLVPDLSLRRRLPERMDDPTLPEADHRRALAGLARLDRVARAERLLWSRLAALDRSDGSPALTVLDVACGGGEPAVPLLLRARAARLPLAFSALDRSPRALDVTAARARREGLEVLRPEPGQPDTVPAPALSLTLLQADALAGLPEQAYDVVMSSLFLHHLSEPQAIDLLAAMKRAARKLVLLHDLRRSRRGWWLALLASRLLTRSSVVHEDALLSVAAAYSPAELGFLAGQAGLNSLHATVSVHWPERLLLSWRRP